MRLFQPVSPRRRRITVYLLAFGVMLALASGAYAARDYQRFQRADALRERAHQHSDAGRNPEAIELYEACVLEYPYFLEGWTSLSELYLEQKDMANAQRCLDQALVYCPETSAQRAVIHRERGSLFLRLGKSREASAELAQACILDPTDGLSARLRAKADSGLTAPGHEHEDPHHGHAH